MRNSIAIYPRKHPRVLFKYLDVNGASLTLKDESLKFTPPNQLNDMFECLPAGVRRSRRLSRKEAGAYLVLQYESASGRIHSPAPVSDQNTLNAWRAGKITREKLEEVRRIAEKQHFLNCNAISRDISILSLSSLPDEILMWGHYAENGSGIVIGFDTTNFPKTLPVHYKSHRVEINLLEKEKSILRMLSTKFKEWKYEKEWRVVALNENLKPEKGFYLYQFHKQSVSTIILGPRTPTKLVEQVLHFVEGTEIKLQKASIDPSRFKLKIFPSSLANDKTEPSR